MDSDCAGDRKIGRISAWRLIAEASGAPLPAAFANVDVNAAASAAGIDSGTLTHWPVCLLESKHPLAISGGAALGQSNGLQTAEAVLTLNALVNNIGKDGGVFLSPLAPLADEYHRPASIKEMVDFVAQASIGQVQGVIRSWRQSII